MTDRQTEMPVWVEVQGRVERDLFTGGWKLVAHRPDGNDWHIPLPDNLEKTFKKLFGKSE